MFQDQETAMAVSRDAMFLDLSFEQELLKSFRSSNYSLFLKDIG